MVFGNIKNVISTMEKGHECPALDFNWIRCGNPFDRDLPARHRYNTTWEESRVVAAITTPSLSSHHRISDLHLATITVNQFTSITSPLWSVDLQKCLVILYDINLTGTITLIRMRNDSKVRRKRTAIFSEMSSRALYYSTVLPGRQESRRHMCKNFPRSLPFLV